MKKLIFILTILFCFISYNMSYAATAKIFEKVPKGQGTRWWNGDVTFPCPFSGGTDCKIKTINKSYIDILEVDYGYIATIGIDEIKYENVISDEIISSDVPGTRIFRDEFILTILHCDEFPSLIGISVDIPETIVDEIGNI